MKIIKAFALFLVMSLVSCDSKPTDKPIKDDNVAYTLFYFGADNNLDDEISKNLKQLEVGVPSNTVGSIYVFMDRYDPEYRQTRGFLYEVSHFSNSIIDSKINSKIIKEYGAINSADPKTVELVISDLAKLYPNKTMQNFSFSSHGSSWIPRGENLYHDPVSRSIGDDSTSKYQMNIDELADVLDKHDIDVLIFDACHMSSIEVYYQLRNSARIIIASPTEILASGFPYEALAPHYATVNLLPDFITKEYIDFYNSKYTYEWGGTISYVVTAKLQEFASLTKRLLEKYNYKDNTSKLFKSLPSYASVNSEFYDDLYSMYVNMDMSDEDKALFEALWSETFPVYNKTGDSMLSGSVNLKDTHGVGFYAPSKFVKAVYNEFYETLDWSSASGLDKLLD